MKSLSEQTVEALQSEHPHHVWALAGFYYPTVWRGERFSNARYPQGTWVCHCGALKRMEHRYRKGLDVTLETEAQRDEEYPQAEAEEVEA